MEDTQKLAPEVVDLQRFEYNLNTVFLEIPDCRNEWKASNYYFWSQLY